MSFFCYYGEIVLMLLLWWQRELLEMNENCEMSPKCYEVASERRLNGRKVAGIDENSPKIVEQ